MPHHPPLTSLPSLPHTYCAQSGFWKTFRCCPPPHLSVSHTYCYTGRVLKTDSLLSPPYHSDVWPAATRQKQQDSKRMIHKTWFACYLVISSFAISSQPWPGVGRDDRIHIVYILSRHRGSYTYRIRIDSAEMIVYIMTVVYDDVTTATMMVQCTILKFSFTQNIEFFMMKWTL